MSYTAIALLSGIAVAAFARALGADGSLFDAQPADRAPRPGGRHDHVSHPDDAPEPAGERRQQDVRQDAAGRDAA